VPSGIGWAARSSRSTRHHRELRRAEGGTALARLHLPLRDGHRGRGGPARITSGEFRRAPTTSPGWSWCIASSVKAPSRRETTRAHAQRPRHRPGRDRRDHSRRRRDHRLRGRCRRGVPSCTRPRIVLATASGSSETSLAMNEDQPPFSAAEASQTTSNGDASGLGDGENFLGSDVAAFVEHTRSALAIGQDEIVAITPGGVDSLAMNEDQPPFSAAEASQTTSNGDASTATPSKSVISTPPGVIAGPARTRRRRAPELAARDRPRRRRELPRVGCRRVRRAHAQRPRHRPGRPGWSWCIASSVKAPSRRETTDRKAAVRSPEVPYSCPSRTAATSVSVSERKV
jgi:hypothetical protein